MSSSEFTFEKLGPADLPFLIEVRNECRDFLHDNREFTLAECERWFRDTNPDFRIIRYNGERIGYFRLSNYDAKERSIYIGADLHKKFRGRGLAREAYEAFIPQLAQSLGLARLKLEVLSHNDRAFALYKRLGFVEIGREKGSIMRNSVSFDSIVMEKALSTDSKTSTLR